jgi:hypothetical protein
VAEVLILVLLKMAVLVVDLVLPLEVRNYLKELVQLAETMAGWVTPMQHGLGVAAVAVQEQ